MEEDTNMNDSSTSAKRSKLEDMKLPIETNVLDCNEDSCSSNDIEMLECSLNQPSTSTNKDKNVTENMKKIKKLNKEKIEIKDDISKNDEDIQSNKDTKFNQEIINEDMQNNLTVKTTTLTEDSTLNEIKTSSNNIDCARVQIEEEMKETASTSNLGQPEIPSENDSVKKSRNRNRHYRPRRISSSDSSVNNSDTDVAGAIETVNNSDSEQEEGLSHQSDIEDESDVERSFHVTDSSSDSSFHDLNYLESNDSDEEEQVSEENNSMQEILTKEKPQYKTNLLYEVLYREHGLSGSGIASARRKDPMRFQNTVCRSRSTMEKLRVIHNLRKHRGCVNSLNFNRAGNLLCTGSDDLKIMLWDWANNKIIHSFLSGHNLNVFQSKFVEIGGGINLVSSARDGQVRHQILPPGASKNISTVLFKHSGPVNKIAICPMNPYEILTAGEDAHVVRCDLREKPIDRLVTVKGKNNQRIGLYSIAHNPLDPEFCVCGRDRFVRVYDKRNVKAPVYLMCPEGFAVDNKRHYSNITCAVYNQSGTEILASYNDGELYLFNNKCYLKGHFTHQYKGLLNYKTIKGVNFFGPNSEYVVSGSDCGNIFIWDKETESIVNWQKGDRSGIVNCIEPHPSFPILATSGLDYDAKIWCPISETAPEMEGLEKCVKQNAKRLASNKNEIFNNRTFLFFISECQRNRRTRFLDRTIYTGNWNDDCPVVQDIPSSSTSEYSTDLDEDDDVRMPCTTQ